MKSLLRAVCFFAILGVLFWGGNVLLQPVWLLYNNYSTMHDFYEQPKNTIETVFIGASTVSADINSTQLYRDYGLCCYDLGSQQQPVMAAYYRLKEAWRLHGGSLKNVVFEVAMLLRTSEKSYYHMGLDWLRWSDVKLQAMKAMSERFHESLFLQLPIGAYHDRWSQLEDVDFAVLLGQLGNNGTRGFYADNLSRRESKYVSEKTPEENYFLPFYALNPEAKPAELDAEAMEYFDKIAAFCAEHDLTLTLYRSPTERGTAARHNAIDEVARQYGVDFLDFNYSPLAGQIGFYPLVDTTDNHHMNVFGAAKLTDWFGRYLSEELGAVDVRGNPKYAHLEKELAIYEDTVAQRDALVTENDPVRYLERAAAMKNCAVFIMVKEEAADALTHKQYAALRDLGLKGLAKLDHSDSFLAVLCDGKVQYQKRRKSAGQEDNEKKDNAVSYEGALPNNRGYSLKSSGSESDAVASCVIDGKERAQNRRGLNVVVYDYKTDTVVDSCVFDTHASAARNADYFLRAQELLTSDAVKPDELDADTKRVFRYCLRCKDKELVQLLRRDLTAAEFTRYLRCFMNEKRFTIYIASAGAPSGRMDEGLADWLARNGFEALSELQCGDSYIGVIDGRKVITEKRDENGETITISPIKGHNLASSGASPANTASIVIQKKEYCPNDRGLNIVVYDSLAESVADTASFDVFAVEQAITENEVIR